VDRLRHGYYYRRFRFIAHRDKIVKYIAELEQRIQALEKR